MAGEAAAISCQPAQTAGSKLDPDTILLKDLAARTHRLSFEARALKAAADQYNTSEMCCYSSLLGSMLQEAVPIESRLSKLQRLSADARPYKKAMAEWETLPDLVKIDRSETEIVPLRNVIWRRLRRPLDGRGSADRDPPPRYSSMESARRDQGPQYTPEESAASRQLSGFHPIDYCV